MVMLLPSKAGTRRIEFNGHQIYSQAYWHAWTKEEDGSIAAVLENENGAVYIQPFVSGITFYDREVI